MWYHIDVPSLRGCRVGAIVLSVLAHGQGFFLVFDPDILSFMAVWAGSKISLDRLVY